jgi:tRNA nucleotidyltransferase (CCA-adding enzyme)
LRYYRRAHQWNFEVDKAIRDVSLEPEILNQVPPEAIASELRSALLDCASPGAFLLDLDECDLLAVISPELALQFDGRPAGPVRYHPEVSQSSHMILALEWIASRSAHLDDRERNRALVAVLCHDLGKGYTPAEKFPAHHGHEESGLEPLRALLGRYPGLTDSRGRRLAEAVCVLHLTIRRVDELRPASRAKLYGKHLRAKDFPVHVFALAVGADSGGRLGQGARGDEVTRRVEADLEWIRGQCETVDVGALWETHKDDKERFESERHQAWARVLRR